LPQLSFAGSLFSQTRLRGSGSPPSFCSLFWLFYRLGNVGSDLLLFFRLGSVLPFAAHSFGQSGVLIELFQSGDFGRVLQAFSVE
jgi:hypothetical protein